MSSNLKKTISYIIPPVITVGLCYVLYSGVDLAAIWAGVKTCSLPAMMAFLLCNVLAMVFRGLRWRLQLRAIGVNPPAAVMSRSIFGTYAVNIVFPRLGEFWRCAYIARIAPAPFSGVFGTMVADRLSDTLMVGIICLLTFAVSSGALARFLSEANLPSGSAMLTSWPVLALIAVMLLAALYVIFGKGRMAARVREFILKTWRGFAVIFTMPARMRWLLLTLGVWACYIASMLLSMMAYPPTAALISGTGGFTAVMVTFVFGSLAMAIPSNGGIGPWQFAVILSLSTLYGLPHNLSLVFATINLGATTLLTILLGLYTFAHIALRKN